MAFDALAALREAGNPVDVLSEAERSVLARLTEEEVATWNSIKARLDAAVGSAAEVEGQGVIVIL
jgi:hypothetical protein